MPDLNIFSIGKILRKISLSGKAHMFWEDHKVLRNVHLTFDWHFTAYLLQIFGTYFIYFHSFDKQHLTSRFKKNQRWLLYISFVCRSVGYMHKYKVLPIGFNPYSKIRLARVGQLFFLFYLKFIYSEKATKFCKISTNYLSSVLPVK